MRHHIQVILAGLLVLSIGYVAYSLVFGGDQLVSLVLLEATGEVSRTDSAGRPLDAVVGTRVGARERLTTGAGGDAVLAVDEHSRIHLESSSTVRVLGVDATGVRVELEGGRVQARVRPGSPAVGINNRGRGVVATDADFSMGVDEEGALVVDNERGQIDLHGFDGVDGLQEGQRLHSMPGRDSVVAEVPASLLLEVAWPEQDTTRDSELGVEGRTEPYASVQLGPEDGGRRIRAGPDGRFSATVPLSEGDNEVRVKVEDPMGRVEEQAHNVHLDSTAPSVTSTEVQYKWPK